MVNPLDIYARASRRLPLTPAERALLRTFDQLLLSAGAGAAVAIIKAALSGGVALSFSSLAQIGEYAFAIALVTGLAKLFRARGDALGATVGSALDQAATRLPAPPRGYRSAPSGPLTPPERAAIMAGVRAVVSSNPQLGAITRPVATLPVPVSAADVTATQATGAQTVTDTPNGQISLSARSTANQAEETPTDEATGDGPTPQQVTQRMAAVRAPADDWTR